MIAQITREFRNTPLTDALAALDCQTAACSDHWRAARDACKIRHWKVPKIVK